jgi:hypothetical protein
MLFDPDRLEWVSESECSNDDLLDAIEYLTLIEHEGTRQRISYADLGVEEIGSVYESLLEFTPRLATEVIELEDRTVSRGEFYLDDRGMERKETGSYYTDPGLVQELVQSALKPVVKDRLEDATTTADQEDALLDITVCDPACGSAAFLVAANNFLAQRLAQIRADSDYPPEDQVREARRDVLQHCIYAVDLNPMAVELAKVSLWINSAVEDKPLNFLDHHIKCGNSLIGTNSDLLEGEFPADAYETSGGRDWHVGNDIRKRVRNENKERSKGSSESSLQQWGAGKEEYVDLAERLEAIGEENTSDIKKKRRLYDELQQSEAFQQEKLAFDVWTAAFYWPMDGSAGEYPTPSTIEKIRRNPNPENEALQELIDRSTELAERQRFFHWELEFPSVYSNGGFDCILGNPPWDKVEMREKEFFATLDARISSAETAAKRESLIKKLETENPELYKRYQKALKTVERKSKFLKESGRFPLTSYGVLNIYAPFVGFALDNIKDKGRVGMIVPSTLATGSNTQKFFREIIEGENLVSLYDFENRNGIFPDIHKSYKFCLLTLSGAKDPVDEFKLSFYLDRIDQLQDQDKQYKLSKEEIELLNPNTKTCPVFNHRNEAELTIKLYKATGVLNEKEAENGNPWDVDLTRTFDTSDDSHLFKTKSELEPESERVRNTYIKDDKRRLPVYEGKLIHQFDNRFSTFEGVSETDTMNGNPRQMNPNEKEDPARSILPRYWISEEEAQKKDDAPWNLVYRSITNVTNRRTVVASIIPYGPAVRSLNLIRGVTAKEALTLLAILNSFPLDYAARQKLGSARLGHYVVYQLPVPDPSQLDNIYIDKKPVRDRINKLSFQLIYTNDSLSKFAEDLGYNKKPFSFTEPSGIPREKIRFKLEAILCHVYSLSLRDFDLLFDSFNQIKQNDLEQYGYYRTKDEVKDYFEEIEPLVERGGEL